MIFVSLVISGHAFAGDYDTRNRQGCIDELKHEVDTVCTPQIQESRDTIAKMLKDSGFIAQTDSRVKRICSYHCPQDITDLCYRYLGKGPATLAGIANGTVDPQEAYKRACKSLYTSIDDAKKEIAARGLGGGDSANSAGGGGKQARGNSLSNGSFRKPSGNTPPPAGKCNPYNSSGAYEVGKCPED
jgi:hypothetical protein